MLQLEITKRTDNRLLWAMSKHYSQPKGFVGRNICYAITYDHQYYGHIIAGSATKHLPGRKAFFSLETLPLNNLVNNVFFHIEKVQGTYPTRNFAQKVLSCWRNIIVSDWLGKYGDQVLGFESLVELPRTGEVYRRDGWTLVGTTKGYTCKRGPGKGSDNWSGKRVWNTTDLRPKLVFVKRA